MRAHLREFLELCAQTLVCNRQENALIGFSDQVDLSKLGDYTGVLRMTFVDADGRRRTVCESASGMLLGSIKLETEFAMHSFDERRMEKARLKGHKLVEEIRRRFPTRWKSRH